MSDTKGAAHRAESRRPANSSSVAHPQDPDPYAYGVNWPGRW